MYRREQLTKYAMDFFLYIMYVKYFFHKINLQTINYDLKSFQCCNFKDAILYLLKAIKCSPSSMLDRSPKNGSGFINHEPIHTKFENA